MTCESIEQSGENAIKNCYSIHGIIEDDLVREYLLLLVKYLKHRKPVLSAAGFFNVNQRTLPTLISAIVTYLVLVAQFDLSLEELKKNSKETQHSY